LSWPVKALILLALAQPLAADEFMSGNLPARSEALGGDSVADPQGSAAVQENLAGLGLSDDGLWMRYQSVVEDVPDLGQGSIAAQWSPLPGLGFGLLWQHLGDPGLERDRFRLGLGLDLGAWAGLKGLSLGVGLDRLVQQYSLDPAYTYAGLPSTSAQAYDAAAGLLWRPCSWFSLGAGADQLTSPNLGLVGEDRFGPMVTWDAGLRVPLPWSSLYLHSGQAWGGQNPVWQSGVEWSSPDEHLSIRAGSDGASVSLGAGFKVGAWRLDYVYRFGLSAEAAAFGGGQGVELGIDLGSPGAAATPGPSPTQTPMPAPTAIPTMIPPPTPQATPSPDLAALEVTQALDLWNQGEKPQALALITRALRGREDLATAGALKQAWQRALTTPTPSPTPGAEAEAGLKEAQVYHAQGRDDLARQTLKALLSKDPGQAEAKTALKALKAPAKVPSARRAKSRKLFESGLRLYGEGRSDEAMVDWEKALKADPDNAEALNSLTRARLQEGKTH
jgi:hypothetical protein